MPVTWSVMAATLGLSFASGLNVYAVLVLVGLLRRFGHVVDLPGELDLLAHPLILWPAMLLYAVEFFIDKRRFLATLWDALHAFVRPMIAAALSFLILSDVSLSWRLFGAFLGGGLAFGVHATKASIRLAANAEPSLGIGSFLSLGEDAVAVILAYLALFHPIAALGVVALGAIGVAIILPRVIVAFLRAVNRTLDAMLSKSP